VDEGTLGVHQVELVVEARPSLSDGCGVAQHAYRSLHFGQVSSWHNGRRLIVEPNFETGWTPVDKL